MKKNFILVALIILMTSCAPKVYFQVFSTSHDSDIQESNHLLIYENEDCKVVYDFWADYGNAGFMIYNKSNDYISIDLNKSFFIRNGEALDYFKNRQWSSKAITQRSSKFSAQFEMLTADNYSIIDNSLKLARHSVESEQNELMYIEKPILIIPPHAAKVVYEYSIAKNLYRFCDLPLVTNKRNIKEIYFTKSNTPLYFTNIIYYSTQGYTKTIKNSFYVNKATVLPYYVMYKLQRSQVDACGKKTLGSFDVLNYDKQAGQFYIKYRSIVTL